MRGLVCRKRDALPFIRQTQEEMLVLVGQARNLEELRQRQLEANALLQTRLTELESGAVPLHELVIEQVISREPESYAVTTRAALAAQELRAEGIPVHPGQAVGYVITNAKAKEKRRRISTKETAQAPQYDIAEYAKRLRAAGAEVYFGLASDNPYQLTVFPHS